MIDGMHTARTRASVPTIGPWVPTATVHLAFLAVAIGLCLLVLEAPCWLGGGLLLAVAGTFGPNLVPRGCLILLLGLSQWWRNRRSRMLSSICCCGRAPASRHR